MTNGDPCSVVCQPGQLAPASGVYLVKHLNQHRGVHEVLVIRGEETPSRSLAEMEALSALPGVETARIPRGKLSVYEEFPDAVAAAIEPFLAA